VWRSAAPARRLAGRDFPSWVFDKEMRFVQDALMGLQSAGLHPEITQYSFCTNGSHYAGEAGIKTVWVLGHRGRIWRTRSIATLKIDHC